MPNREPTPEMIALARDPRPVPPRCKDFDEDCDDVADKVHCWLYDPAKGYCPYLRNGDHLHD